MSDSVRRRAGGGRAPLVAGHLPDGTPFVGQLGVLAIDEVADRVQCALCGRWLRSLGGSHLQAGHGWTAEQYRAAFGLTLHRSLDCPGRNSQRAALQRDRMVSDPQIREAIAAAGQRARNGELLRAARRADASPGRDIYQRPERRRLQRSRAQRGGAIRAERAAADRLDAARRLGFGDVRTYLLVRAGRDQISVLQMASELGCARETIAALLAEHGIARPTQSIEAQAVAATGFASFADYLTARHADRMSVAAMARELGHSTVWVQARARRDGLGHLVQPAPDGLTRARALANANGFDRAEDFVRHRYEADRRGVAQLHDELALPKRLIAGLLAASGTPRRTDPTVDERTVLAAHGYDDLTRYVTDRVAAGLSVTAMADELGRSHVWLARRLRARGLGRLIHAKHGKRVDVDTLTRRLGFADLADYAQQRAATGHSLVAMARELGHSDTWLAGRLRAAGLGHLINPPGRPRARTREAGDSREPPAVHSGTSN